MARPRALATAVALTATVVVGWAAPADAAAYRYWTYWLADTGTWVFASTGPAFLVPADGSVEGWRFAVTTRAGGSSTGPRSAPSFAQVCAGTAPQAGRKRVAVVIDPGAPADAPAGQAPGRPSATCVVADVDATGYQVLRSIAPVRVEGGLVCGIDGYPTGECAPVVEDTPVEPSTGVDPSTGVGASPAAGAAADAGAATDAGTPWPVAVVVAVAVGVGGLLLRRRSRG